MPSASDNGPAVLPNIESLIELAALIAATQPLVTPTLHLLIQNIGVTPSTPLSTLTAAEATFTGYAAVASIAWGTVGNSPGGGAEVFAPSHTFTASGTPTAQTVYGWYLTDVGVTVLLRYVPLVAPVPIQIAGDQVVIQPALQLS